MESGFDFPLLLVSLTLITGVIAGLDWLYCAWRSRRSAAQLKRSEPKSKGWLVSYSRSFFPVLLLVLIVRSFVFQPYRVPTGSLEPTVVPGDIIAVNQSAYALRLPVTYTTLLTISQPQRGDIAVFRWPPNPDINFVKRVIGLPGDTVAYKDKVLYINGKEAKQTVVGPRYDEEGEQGEPVVIEKIEDLDGVKHQIFVWPQGGLDQDFSITVPPQHYFMMGDNRDNSDDSRAWGPVPEEYFLGRAYAVLFSWDGLDDSVRWSRIGHGLE